MPFTFNGFGTRYAGRSNETTDWGACEHCGREARISSYDTRLWICALFVPVIPLGRKRILDDCSRCRRHRQIPLEQYRQLEDEAVRESEAAYRADGGDPDPALAHLSRLLAFRRHDEAMALAEELARRFPDRPAVQVAIAPLYRAAGRGDEADRLLERAHRADASDPAARQALAWSHLAAGRVDEARVLIDGQRAGTPDPHLLFTLAVAEQERGDSVTALSRFEELLSRHPELAEDKGYRSAVAGAEKAAGVTESMLPRRARPTGKIAAVVVVVAVIAAVAIGSYHYLRTHRRLHVVSAVPGAISVTVDDGDRLVLSGPGRAEMTVPEGARRARIEGELEETVELSIEIGFWEGLTGQPVFVLNPGGLAVVGWEEIFYGEPAAGSEPRTRLYAGRRFVDLGKADYLFRDFPPEIQIDSRSKGATRSRVFDLPGEPPTLAGWLLRYGERDEAVDYLAAWLTGAPSDEIALTYAGVAAASGRAAEAAELLRPHLTTDPINVEWHRAYQNVSEAVAEREAALRVEYDRLIAERPNEPLAHYLRARIEPDPNRAQELHARALRLDPALEHAARGSAYLALSGGEFARAVDVLRGPAGREGASDDTVDLYASALLATGRDEELESILDAERARPPAEADWDRARKLILLLVRNGRAGEAETWINELDKRSGDEPSGLLAAYLRSHLLYASARFEELRALAGQVELLPVIAGPAAFWAAVEQGDVNSINRTFEELDTVEREGFNELVLSLTLARSGAAGLSRRWQDSALAHLAPADRGYRALAELLGEDVPVTPAALARVTLPPREKATLLTLLAVRRPEAADLALAEADRLNFEPVFPYHFLRRFQADAAAEDGG